MALHIGQQLVGPGDVRTDASSYGNVGGGQGSPMWEVGNPLAISMAGLRDAVENYALTRDDVIVSDFQLRKQKELEQKYLHPETGLFNTRKGEAAQGIYNDLLEDAKRITDQDAMRELTERQRQLVNKPLATMFTHWGTQVGSFETQQLMNHQVNMIDNNINSAMELVASGSLDTNSMGMFVSNVSNMYAARGKIEGWDDATILRKSREAVGTAVAKAAGSLGATDPVKAMGAVDTFEQYMTPLQKQGIMAILSEKANTFFKEKAYEDRQLYGDKVALQNAWKKTSSGRIADQVSTLESAEGSMGIGYDSTGGTSYGRFQISSSTMPAFIKWLDENENTEAAKRLRDAGPANTGSKAGKMVDVWKQAVEEGLITDIMQDHFIQETHVKPLVNKLPEELVARMNDNSAYGRAIFSTAVQHGSSRGANLVKKAWDASGGDDGRFLNELYDLRKKSFGSSTENERAGVYKRLDKEMKMNLADVGGTPKGQVEPGNINLYTRPQVKMPDGSVATVRSVTFEEDGQAVLVPSVSDNGDLLNDEEALALYRKTGKHLGKFKTEEEASTYAKNLSQQQNSYYNGWTRGKPEMKPSTYNALAKEFKAENRRMSTEARQAVKQFENSAEYYLATGDDSAIVADKQYAMALGNEDAIKEINDMDSVYRGLQPLMLENSLMPIQNQAAALEEWLRDNRFIDNAKAMAKVRDQFKKVVQKRNDEINKDSMGYFKRQRADQEAWRQKRDAASPQQEASTHTIEKPRDMEDNSSEAVRQSDLRYREIVDGIEWQRSMGLPLSPLTKEESTALKALASDPANIRNAIGAIYDYRDFGELAMQQAGVHGGVNFAITSVLEQGWDKLPQAQLLAAFATRPDAEIYVGDETRKVKYMADAEEDATVDFLTKTAAVFPLDDAASKQVKEVKETVAKMLATGHEAVMNEINQGYSTVADDHSSFQVAMGWNTGTTNVRIRVPANIGYSAQDVAYGMGKYTDMLGTEQVPLRGPQTRESIEALRQRGTWVSTQSGEATYMNDRGVPVLKANGEPLTVNMRAMAEKAKIDRATATKETEMKAQNDLLRESGFRYNKSGSLVRIEETETTPFDFNIHMYSN